MTIREGLSFNQSKHAALLDHQLFARSYTFPAQQLLPSQHRKARMAPGRGVREDMGLGLHSFRRSTRALSDPTP